MLEYEVESVAYLGNGKVLCRECALKAYAAAGGDKKALEDLTWDEDDELIYERTGLDALTRRQAEEEFDDEVEGLYCDECRALILEPVTLSDEEEMPSCSDVTGGVEDDDLFEVWGLWPEDVEVDEEEGHLWARPWELVGGLKENPGVVGYGGGIVETRVCLRCGTTRTTDTTPTDWGPSVWDVSYERNVYATEMAQAGAKARVEAWKREEEEEGGQDV